MIEIHALLIATVLLNLFAVVGIMYYLFAVLLPAEVRDVTRAIDELKTSVQSWPASPPAAPIGHAPFDVDVFVREVRGLLQQVRQAIVHFEIASTTRTAAPEVEDSTLPRIQ